MHRRTAVNQLVADALQAYWNWWQHFNSVRLVDSSLSNAQKRFTMVKTAFILGDRPAIDTIEALAQVQTFALQKTEVEMQLQKSSIELSGFLWKEDNQSYQLSEEIVPAPKAMMDISIDDLLQKGNLHPELLTYKYKLNSLQIEKKLKFQSLLPDIDVKYQYLSKGYNPTKNLGTSFFENNYRFALSFSMPLRLSEGRGEFQKAKLKIKQTSLQQLDKSTQIQNKIKQYFTEWQQTSKQLTTQQNIISNYFLLQTGEETRFFNGESSLFLVNSREQKTLEAKQKQIELQSKRYKAFTNLLWSAGVFGN
jgi:outer membrane protein TolC